MVPIFGLDSNRAITPDELERCAGLVAALRATPPSDRLGTEARWTTMEGVPAHDLTKMSLDRFDPDFVRRLRQYSYIFTGYHLSDILTGARSPTWGAPPWASADWPDWAIPTFYMYRNRMPAEVFLTPPLVAGEVGYNLFGSCVNRDVIAYLDRIKLLSEAGIIDRLKQLDRPRILEIGGGYGGLAYFLTRILPRASYTIVDLRTSLMHSGCYLTVAQSTHPVRLSDGTGAEGAEIELVANTMAETLDGRRFDLAINTISFAEMPAEVVRGYASLIDRTLADDGRLFEQNCVLDLDAIGRDNFCAPELVLAERLQYLGFLTHSGDGIWPARLWSGGSAGRSGPSSSAA
jgi:hypothetical protein